MNHGIDMYIRQIGATEALEKTPQLWANLKNLPPHDMPSQSTYIEIIRFTARRILVKLEEAGLDEETWKTYTDFFTEAILAYGTSNTHFYLQISERLLIAVLGYPSAPVPLLKDYLTCAVAQGNQRETEVAAFLAKYPRGVSPPVMAPPNLEYAGRFVGCVTPKPVSQAVCVLEHLPTQLTFAHRHAIMHLKLCNPLRIPGCSYVSTGYRCDTCHLRGIRVGFQAMLYHEEETAEKAGTTADLNGRSNVRSDAQIARKTLYGFDICLACAVTFYAEQRDLLHRLLQPPHIGFEFGSAAGVQISQAKYRLRRHAVASTGSSPAYPLSREASSIKQHASTVVFPSPVAAASPAAVATADNQLAGGLTTSQSFSPLKQQESECTIYMTASDSFCEGSHATRSGTAAGGGVKCSDTPVSAATAAAGPFSASLVGPAASLPAVSAQSAPSSPQRPPSRPPLRRMTWGLNAPTPPSSRCATCDVSYISLTVTLAPYGARPIAWILSSAEKAATVKNVEDVLSKRLGPSSSWRSGVKVTSSAAALRRASTGSAQVTDRPTFNGLSTLPFVEVGAEAEAVSESLHLGLAPLSPLQPLPPSYSRASATPPRLTLLNDTSPVRSVSSSDDDDDDTCSICLRSYEGEEPIIETSCHHWFHICCIKDYTRIAEDVCPLCRARHVLPDMSRATALKKNTFNIDVQLTKEQSQLPYLDVCVGAILTRDGNYRNASSIAAAQCVRVEPNQLRVFEEVSPLHKPICR